MTPTKSLTPGQLAWARQHDWFVSTVFAANDMGALVEDRDSLDNVEHRIFTDFRTLKAWAGY
jgi:hypothetical protein